MMAQVGTGHLIPETSRLEAGYLSTCHGVTLFTKMINQEDAGVCCFYSIIHHTSQPTNGQSSTPEAPQNHPQSHHISRLDGHLLLPLMEELNPPKLNLAHPPRPKIRIPSQPKTNANFAQYTNSAHHRFYPTHSSIQPRNNAFPSFYQHSRGLFNLQIS